MVCHEFVCQVLREGGAFKVLYNSFRNLES